MTPQEIIQSLRRALSIVRRRQLKLPCSSQHRQPVTIPSWRPAVRVTWFVPLRYCTKQVWYHEACYKKHPARHNGQKVKWISYWDIEGDIMCHICHKWIDGHKSMHTVEMPKVEKQQWR